MKIHFFKYQATGNDFVVIDNLSGELALSVEQIRTICHRRFGVGADGLMLIERHPTADFNLQYYNSDGSQSLCGNGSRAAVSMAASLGLVKGKAQFQAFDGLHTAEISNGVVRLRMNDVTELKTFREDFYLNTGSPHYVRFVPAVHEHPVVEEGAKLRHDPAFAPGGTNVNFVEKLGDNAIFVRTFERGVEDETLSCGTGVTAAALAASRLGMSPPVKVKTLGGELEVGFKPCLSAGLPGKAAIFEDIYLTGPAKLVFEGDLEL